MGFYGLNILFTLVCFLFFAGYASASRGVFGAF